MRPPRRPKYHAAKDGPEPGQYHGGKPGAFDRTKAGVPSTVPFRYAVDRFKGPTSPRASSKVPDPGAYNLPGAFKRHKEAAHSTFKDTPGHGGPLKRPVRLNEWVSHLVGRPRTRGGKSPGPGQYDVSHGTVSHKVQRARDSGPSAAFLAPRNGGGAGHGSAIGVGAYGGDYGAGGDVGGHRGEAGGGGRGTRQTGGGGDSVGKGDGLGSLRSTQTFEGGPSVVSIGDPYGDTARDRARGGLWGGRGDELTRLSLFIVLHCDAFLVWQALGSPLLRCARDGPDCAGACMVWSHQARRHVHVPLLQERVPGVPRSMA